MLADVARTFGRHDVSIAQVHQEAVADGMELVIVTHLALEASLQATVYDLQTNTDGVRAVANVLRVESEVAA